MYKFISDGILLNGIPSETSFPSSNMNSANNPKLTIRQRLWVDGVRGKGVELGFYILMYSLLSLKFKISKDPSMWCSNIWYQWVDFVSFIIHRRVLTCDYWPDLHYRDG